MGVRRPRQAVEERETVARPVQQPDTEAATALKRRSMRPDDILALQEAAGNQAIVQSLKARLTAASAADPVVMRQPTAVKESTKLKAAATKLASAAGVDVAKVQTELEFYVENGFGEAALVRAATGVARLAGKSGAGLYAALLKVPTGDLEAYWVTGLLAEGKHPELTTAIRLVRDYRTEVWFDLAETLSHDESAAKLFFEALSPADVEKAWATVQKESKLSPGARTRLGEIVAAIEAAAAKVDVEATAKLLAPVAGKSVKDMREELEIAAGVGFKAADLKRLAPVVVRLSKIKWGAPLYEALLQQSTADLEALTVLAARLGDKHSRFATAVELVFWFRIETWVGFAQAAEKDYDATKLLLDTVPPTELETMWKGLEHSGLDKRKIDELRGTTERAMHEATKGDSGRAFGERYRGQEAGKALEKRVDTVLEHTKFRRKDMVANIGRAVGHVDSTLRSLLDLADLYKKARGRVEDTIKRAEAEAKLDQEKMDFILGVAIGVGVGLGLGAAVPLAEGASRSVEAGLDAVGEVYEAGVGDIVKRTTAGPGGGAPAAGDYARADPQVKQTEAYKRCGELYRQLASLAPRIEDVSAVADVGAKVKADARELATTGSHATLVIPELERMVATLERADEQMKSAESEVFELEWTLSAQAEQAKREAARSDQLRMEKQIWIHWLGSRTEDEAELAGREPVKGTLKARGVVAEEDEDSSIGWGVGWYHSAENSRTGAKRAAAYSEALSLAGREGELIEGQARELSTRTKDPSAGNVTYASTRRGVVGKVKVDGKTYGVEVIGLAAPGAPLIITGVVGREDRALYPGGEDKDNLGIVLSARPKPKTAQEAVSALGDDTDPEHAI